MLLSTLLDEVGFDRKAKFLLAEGADGAALTRTIPMAMALDDVIVVLRPERRDAAARSRAIRCGCSCPACRACRASSGCAGSKIGDAPWNTREESLHYVDMMPGGKHRQYTWIQEAKSVITAPSGGQVMLDRGFHEITGLAWSGRGKVRRVDVSTDGGRNWRTARLQEPVHTKALTRFRIDWQWDGGPALLQSRVIDETGYVQPTYPPACAKFAARARSITTTRSRPGVSMPTGDVSNVQVV